MEEGGKAKTGAAGAAKRRRMWLPHGWVAVAAGNALRRWADALPKLTAKF